MASEFDRQAMQGFRARNPDLRFCALTVVIAAYNEAANIGAVLDRIPKQVCSLPVSVLVVDDGSRDGTAAVAASHGANVLASPTNRGQGAALRLGYSLAVTLGARFIATTDADGQYDASELPLLVEPLVRDEADFVTGSRRLGLYQSTDMVRHTGVHVFARLLSLIARQRITDTSNGLRAFKAGIVEHITLSQPQYQATELLIGVIYRGFRVAERGTTMRPRSSGSSKKGPNLVYGYRFGGVILSTWLRELRRNRAEGRRLSDPAPDLALGRPGDDVAVTPHPAGQLD
ncbi:MAG: glycosyltransferase family 2 protein [Actinomycetota bacterium]|nr:glycosyltransferase family 2 protein [Actinomycetota bacterium]